MQASGATLQDNGLLGLSASEVTAQLRTALEGSGYFHLLADGEQPPEDAVVSSMSLELPFTRESKKDGREGTFAEVGANLSIRRRVKKETLRYEVVGLGEVRIQNDADRSRAMKAALTSALHQVAQSAHLQLAALDKSDHELIKDLKDPDASTREFAIRVLAERKNPAVVDVLIDRLKTSTDADQLRRAMGTLAEMRVQKAVNPLIDLTRGKDPEFVREVVFAIAQIGGDEAMAYLFTVAQGHENPALRDAAQKALDELEHRNRLQRGHTQKDKP